MSKLLTSPTKLRFDDPSYFFSHAHSRTGPTCRISKGGGGGVHCFILTGLRLYYFSMLIQIDKSEKKFIHEFNQRFNYYK